MHQNIHVHVQPQDFNLGWHYDQLRRHPGGATCLFVGQVRDLADGSLHALEIEHFPGMAHTCLETIAAQAWQRWKLHALHLVHRYGMLARDDQIVLVGTASDHRADAFDACRFVMDYLKTDAPFWKKVHHQHGSEWISADTRDTRVRNSWEI